MEAEPIIYRWHFDPLIMLLMALIVYGYYRISHFSHRRANWFFWTAMSLFFITECSPLHFLGMHYYFSIHMLGHIIILLICGPLFVMSIPQRPTLFLQKKLQQICGFFYRYSWLAWLAGVGIMWFWHIPVIFDGTFNSSHSLSWLPLLHAGSILLGGILFSLPLFGPFADKQVHPLTGVLYLFTACVSCSLLGLLITFAPIGIYHHYLDLSLHAQMPGNPWGVTILQDQQAAGLIMWVPCCFIYLGGCIYLLVRWFAGSSHKYDKDWVKVDQLIIDHDRKR